VSKSSPVNRLYFGDNLNVLRERIADESVDLIYLDPPFNSNANYNVLFKAQTGQSSQAQAEAFRDTWEWGEPARDAYDDVMRANGDVALIVSGLRKSLGDSAMMAYLAMMAARFIELRRVLKPSGSLYLHCDPTASHYLKVIVDAAFGPTNYRNEISWRRQSAHNDAKQGRRQYGNVRDVIFFYTRGEEWTWNSQYTPYDPEYIGAFYKHVEPETGRRYRLSDLTGPGGAAKGNPRYKVLGVERYWRFSKEKMAALIAEGRVVQLNPGNVPAQKRYLDEMPGVALQNDWGDIRPAAGRERLGYPTQKPLALLERIIRASSDEGQVVLDPFCGCGTTVEAAQKLKRQWIGIDVTHYAVTLIENRLKGLHVASNSYQVVGRPADLAGARELARRDKHQFQWWAAWYLGSHTYREEKRGADRGIDGNIFYPNGPYGTGRIITSVKGGENVGVAMVRDLRGVIEREEAQMGILVTLTEPTGPMLAECASAGFVTKSAHGRMPRLQLLTIADMLDGRLPKLPPIPDRVETKAKPRRKSDGDQIELLLPFKGAAIKPAKGDFVDPRFDSRLFQSAE
jgi:DNA modification methylase